MTDFDHDWRSEFERLLVEYREAVRAEREARHAFVASLAVGVPIIVYGLLSWWLGWPWL